MPRKHHYDLREFWPWYERQWPTRYGLHATPPPFNLSDISQTEQATPTERRVAQAMFILLFALAIGMVVWGLFFG
jgi:hypothetical protein